MPNQPANQYSLIEKKLSALSWISASIEARRSHPGSSPRFHQAIANVPLHFAGLMAVIYSLGTLVAWLLEDQVLRIEVMHEFLVLGVTLPFAAIGTFILVGVQYAGSRLPHTYELLLGNLLKEYDPIDANAFVELQKQTAAVKELNYELISQWLTVEKMAVNAALLQAKPVPDELAFVSKVVD